MTSKCICSVCDHKAQAVPGKRHRRCPGGMGQATIDSTGEHIPHTLPLLAKSAKLPRASRGIWQGPALASK